MTQEEEKKLVESEVPRTGFTDAPVTKPRVLSGQPISPDFINDAVEAGIPDPMVNVQTIMPKAQPVAALPDNAPSRQDVLDHDMQNRYAQTNPTKVLETIPEVKSVDPTRQSITDAQRATLSAIADYAQGVKDDYDKMRKEDETLIKADTKAATWTGATELAASLANLFFVGSKGASNQVYKSRSQDWMAKAEQGVEKSRGRILQARERQRSIELEKEKAKAQASTTLAKYDMQKQQADAARQAQMIKLKLEAAKQAADEKFRQGKLTIEQYKAQVDAAAKAAKQATDDAVAQSTIKRNNAAASSSYELAQKYKSERNGGGDNKKIPIAFGETGENGKDEVFNINPESMLNTISANMEYLRDELDGTALKEVERLIKTSGTTDAKKTAEKLVQYVRKSPRVMDLIRQTAGVNAPSTSGTSTQTNNGGIVFPGR